MAKKAYKDRWLFLLGQADKEMRKSGGFFLEDGTVLTLELSGDEFVSAFQQATEGILKINNIKNNRLNTKKNWKAAYSAMLTKLPSMRFQHLGTPQPKGTSYVSIAQNASGPQVVLNTGVYIVKANQTSLALDFVASNADGSIDIDKTDANLLLGQVKDTVWNEWVDIVRNQTGDNQLLGKAHEQGRRFSQSALRRQRRERRDAVQSELPIGTPDGGTSGTYSQLLTDGGVKKSHRESSTTGVKILESFLNNAPAITFENSTLQVSKFAEHYLSGIELKARNKRLEKKLGGVKVPGQNHLIEVRLSTNKQEKTDLKPIKKAAEEYIANFVKEEIAAGRILSGDEEGSKSYNDSLRDAAVKAVVDKFTTKNNIKVKRKPKIAKTKKHDYTVSVGNKSNRYKGKTKKKNLSLAGSAAVMRAASSVRDKAGRPAKQKSPAQIKQYINAGLHNEIQRNMGRPALNYVSGQFARSAYLTNLRAGPKSMIGEYTYQLDPYQTFENTGQAQWPLGYNPKPLIARSIRNLALKHTQSKFTLRRV